MSNQTSSMPAERVSVLLETAATREAIRESHQVRLIDRADEGEAAHKLPNGIFGFTFAPLTETPVFAKHSHQSFEVHKLPDGELCLISGTFRRRMKRDSIRIPGAKRRNW